MPAVLASLPRAGETVDRYRIVAPVAQGGMAAVYAVRREGPGGFDKLLALKMMLPHLAAERRYVDMFLDEARIASQLQHVNLAQVFDTGEHGGVPYLVMEFLSGKSWSECLRRAGDRGEPVSVELVCGVLGEAAKGLHAAHEATDANGAPLNVVHRDVSPQNIHVGYDGHVKVVDFGIALASGRLDVTRTGEVKGKMAYVSPEMLDRQQPVDRRADIWALGVMAWEIFSGDRLFHSDVDARTMANVLQAPIAPLATVAPKVPKAVAAVVDQCLQRDVARRPPTAAHVAQAFRPFAVDGPALRDWVERLFAVDKISEAAMLLPLATPASTAVAGAATPVAADVASSDDDSFDPTAIRPTPAARGVWGWAVAAALVLGGGGVAWRLSAKPSPPIVAAPTPVETPRAAPAPVAPDPVLPREAEVPATNAVSTAANAVVPAPDPRPASHGAAKKATTRVKTPPPAPAPTEPPAKPLLSNPY